MSYDDELATRVRAVLADRAEVTEKKMFGGLAFLLEGHMFCGIVKDELMVRVGPERYTKALAEPGARPMDFTGRPMAGYVFVTPKGYRTSATLARWVGWGAEFVASLDRTTVTKRRRGTIKKRPRATRRRRSRP